MGLIAFAAGGCSRASKSDRSEVILFTAIGNLPFEDYVYAIRTDGSHLVRVLMPGRGRSYMAASGNSLQDELVVKVHEADPTGTVGNHLYLYNPASFEWRRLKVGGGLEGRGVIAPHNSFVVYALAPQLQPRRYELWVANLQTGESRKLTGVEGESWDAHPSWRPDGQEIVFLRFQLAATGVLTTLMQVPSTGGPASVLLGPENGVAGAAYGPDGKHLCVLSKRGVEILDTTTMERNVILSPTGLQGRAYRLGSVAWSKTQNIVAFSALNSASRKCELWTLSPDRGDAKRIYGVKDGTIEYVTFVQK